MRVTWAKLRDFRSYGRATVELSPGLTVVHGPNGAGKTNLLEALYFGCTARPIRTTNDREVIRFGAPAARVVVGTADEHGEHELSVGYGLLPGDDKPVKRMQVDGVTVDRLADAACRPLLSVFFPDRLELIKGSPALRRAHLDQLTAALWPARSEVRRLYARTLLQRNSLLAGIRAGRSSHATLSSWDVELSRLAVELAEQRDSAVALVDEPFRHRAGQLGLSGDAHLEYRPRSKARSADEFLVELQQRRDADIERGFSTYGPHRDELAVMRANRELRCYGSQGEQRLGLLALLLAERDVLTDMRGNPPLMLLDDVTSELDIERRGLLVDVLSGSGQSVITATEPSHVPYGGSPDRLDVCPQEVLTDQPTMIAPAPVAS